MEHFRAPNLDAVRETTRENVSSTRLTASTSMPKANLTPMDRAMAAKLVRRLLAGYPNLNAHDPEGYVAVLVQAMSGYPQWAGERAVLRVDAENMRFPPTEKVVRGWLEEAVAPFRFAEEWQRRARQQIADRTPDEEGPKYMGTRGDGGPGTTYTNYDEAVAKHGRPFGAFDQERKLPYKG